MNKPTNKPRTTAQKKKEERERGREKKKEKTCDYQSVNQSINRQRLVLLVLVRFFKNNIVVVICMYTCGLGTGVAMY